jgi:hypothetical protein
LGWLHGCFIVTDYRLSCYHDDPARRQTVARRGGRQEGRGTAMRTRTRIGAGVALGMLALVLAGIGAEQ